MEAQAIKEAVVILKNALATNNDYRNQTAFCPLCNGNIKDREIAIYTGLIKTLKAVYRYCLDHKIHEFETKDIKHLMDKNSYARFGDLVRFGGIIYKPEDSRKAQFGINLERAGAFFRGEYEIPVSITINQITNEVIDRKMVNIKDIPDLREYLDDDGLYNKY